MTIAAIDLGGTRTKFGLIDGGNVIATHSCDADAGGHVGLHLERVIQQLEAMCSTNGFKLADCRGIGLLSTGVVDNRNMRVLSTNGKYDDATEFDFRGWALEKTGLELRMDNDARGALLGEWCFGAAKGCDNAVMMTIGTGIGTSVLMHGAPITGPHFTAGLLGGHIIINSNGNPCTCGAVGCLETEASGWALPGLVKGHPLFSESTLAQAERIDFKTLFDHAEAGDATALAIRNRCLQLWGEAVVSYIHLYDPERIVIGGGVMNAPALVLERTRQIVDEMAWADKDQVEIVPATHPDNAGIYGASALFQLN